MLSLEGSNFQLALYYHVMDEHFLELIENLIDGRNDFITRTMQLTPHQQRPQMLSRFMLNEVCYLEILNRMYQNYARNQLASAVLTFALPNNFNDPVPVIPSPEQITAALENIDSTTANCAICQDSISSGACRIRQCGHVYHRSCISSWFAVNVRCPVCRHDIRETGQPNRRPSDEG